MSEKLQNIDNTCVISSLGWKVDVTSIDAVRYSEQDRSLELKLEDHPTVTGELEWILYTPDIWRWQAAVAEDVIPPEKVSQILERIRLAFWKMDMPIKEIH